MIVFAHHARQAADGLSGWEQLGIVVAGSLIAATIIGVFSWVRKPAHRVHVVGTQLRAVLRDFGEIADSDARSHELIVELEVTNTSDISLEAMLAKLSFSMDGAPLEGPGPPGRRHQLAPEQHHSFGVSVSFDPQDRLGMDGPESVRVDFRIDYGRPLMWWMRRGITASAGAKFRAGFFTTFSDPRGILDEHWTDGGSPRDRLVWPLVKRW